jgi:hypothetical protein
MSVFNPREAAARRNKEMMRLVRLQNEIDTHAAAVTASLTAFKDANSKLRDALHRLRCAYEPTPSEDEIKSALGVEIARILGPLDFISWLDVGVSVLATADKTPALRSKFSAAAEVLREKMSQKHKVEERTIEDAETAFAAIPIDQREELFLTDAFVREFTNKQGAS